MFKRYSFSYKRWLYKTSFCFIFIAITLQAHTYYIFMVGYTYLMVNALSTTCSSREFRRPKCFVVSNVRSFRTLARALYRWSKAKVHKGRTGKRCEAGLLVCPGGDSYSATYTASSRTPDDEGRKGHETQRICEWEPNGVKWEPKPSCTVRGTLTNGGHIPPTTRKGWRAGYTSPSTAEQVSLKRRDKANRYCLQRCARHSPFSQALAN